MSQYGKQANTPIHQQTDEENHPQKKKTKMHEKDCRHIYPAQGRLFTFDHDVDCK